MRFAEINALQSSEIDEVLKLLIQDILHHTGSQENMEKETAVYEGQHDIKIEQDEELLLGWSFVLRWVFKLKFFES